VPQTSSETYYYTVNPIRLAARTRDNFLVRYTLKGDLPSGALVGQSGQFLTGTEGQPPETEDVFWRVEASDVPETAWVCLNFVRIRAHKGQCVRVAASNGAILGGRVVTQFGGPLGLPLDLR